jgi:putative PIN family toxin of toxin-antitoxin system
MPTAPAQLAHRRYNRGQKQRGPQPRPRQRTSAPKSMPTSLTLVLDTNVVLDWLVFRDAGVERLQAAVEQRRVTIVTHAAAIDELYRVLAYPRCKLAAADQEALLSRYRMATREAALPTDFSLANLLLPAGFPSCRDADDQHFLALAYHAKADGLLTKDRQLLRLRKRAARFGVAIASPREFVAAL